MRGIIALYAHPSFVATVVVTLHKFPATVAANRILEQSQMDDVLCPCAENDNLAVVKRTQTVVKLAFVVTCTNGRLHIQDFNDVEFAQLLRRESCS